jgi:hypothetical protein
MPELRADPDKFTVFDCPKRSADALYAEKEIAALSEITDQFRALA